MKKKLLLTVMALVCALTCAFGLAACDNDESNQTIFYELNNDNQSYTIIAPIGGHKIIEGELIIPDTYQGKPVTRIGNNAFSLQTAITSVIIPDSVTEIVGAAFSGCTGIESVTIGKNVKTIGDVAFNGCKSLTSITIPDSVTSVGSDAFFGCDKLTSFIAGTGLTSINRIGCHNIESLTINASLTNISEGAFGGADYLKSVTFSGTKAQWAAVPKGIEWETIVGGRNGGYTVYCKDGNILVEIDVIYSE